MSANSLRGIRINARLIRGCFAWISSPCQRGKKNNRRTFSVHFPGTRVWALWRKCPPGTTSRLIWVNWYPAWKVRGVIISIPPARYPVPAFWAWWRRSDYADTTKHSTVDDRRWQWSLWYRGSFFQQPGTPCKNSVHEGPQTGFFTKSVFSCEKKATERPLHHFSKYIVRYHFIDRANETRYEKNEISLYLDRGTRLNVSRYTDTRENTIAGHDFEIDLEIESQEFPVS